MNDVINILTEMKMTAAKAYVFNTLLDPMDVLQKTCHVLVLMETYQNIITANTDKAMEAIKQAIKINDEIIRISS